MFTAFGWKYIDKFTISHLTHYHDNNFASEIGQTVVPFPCQCWNRVLSLSLYPSLYPSHHSIPEYKVGWCLVSVIQGWPVLDAECASDKNRTFFLQCQLPQCLACTFQFKRMHACSAFDTSAGYTKSIKYHEFRVHANMRLNAVATRKNTRVILILFFLFSFFVSCCCLFWFLSVTLCHVRDNDASHKLTENIENVRRET